MNGEGLRVDEFRLDVSGRSVPGVYWSPEGGGDRLVLLGHGGTGHKRMEYVVEVAELLVARGIAAAAIDGPAHGDRSPEGEADLAFEDRWHRGGGTEAIVADWRAALDHLEAEHGARPTGWWGLSMGTMMGLPVAADDPRIRLAVLGLMGHWGPNAEDLQEAAPRFGCPVRFLVQWDDEIVPRQSCLDLFDAIGSSRKTLHANPGLHAEVPSVEVISSVEYLDRYLA